MSLNCGDTSISHERNDMYFNYRTCGIAIKDGRVLCVKISPYDFYLFPGGRVEFLESSKSALVREIKEELNTTCRIVRLLWMVEDFYNFENQKVHEICHYYLIELPDEAEISQNDEWIVNEAEKPGERAKKLSFQWIPLDRLEKVKLIPHYIKAKLTSLPQEIELIIVDHIKKEAACEL